MHLSFYKYIVWPDMHIKQEAVKWVGSLGKKKRNALATHSHISWPSDSSQCDRQGCRPGMRGRRQRLSADSRPSGACLYVRTSPCGRGSEEFCHSWFPTFCRVPSSTGKSFPRWSGSPGRGLWHWGGSVWGHSLVRLFFLLPFLLSSPFSPFAPCDGLHHGPPFSNSSFYEFCPSWPRTKRWWRRGLARVR